MRAEYTEVWVASQNVPLIRFADRVRAISETGLDWLGLPDREPPAPLLETLRGFDSIVSWYGANRPEFREAVAGLPFQFRPALPPEPGIPRLDCPRWDGGFAVIHPFSGGPRKNWPLDRFREVARRLPVPVRWCAGPAEPLEDAVRIENLYELACWLAGARLYIGNDSGITHLAAAAGAPVVAVFIASDPAIWAPRGDRVRVVTSGDTAGVIAAAETLLRSG